MNFIKNEHLSQKFRSQMNILKTIIFLVFPFLIALNASFSFGIKLEESASTFQQACTPCVIETVPIPDTILPNCEDGLGHDGTNLWIPVTRLAPEVRVYEIHPSSGNILRSYLQNHYNPASSNVIGLAYDSINNLIYNQVYPYGPIYAVDASTLIEVPGSEIPVPASWIHDITFDSFNQILWAIKDYGTIYQIDPFDGSVLGSFTSPGTTGVTWDGNYLWVTGAGFLYQIDSDQALADGNCAKAIVQQIYLQGIGAPAGRLAWDGRFLWTQSSAQGLFYKIGVCPTLITPNGGEVIPSGSTYTIKWGTFPGATSFKLMYSMNKGKKWKLIDGGMTGTSFDWQVPTSPKNKKKCLVKVIGYDASGRKVGADTSDSTFTIEVAKVTFPNGGETLASGYPYTITWTTNETKGAVAKVVLKYTQNGGVTWEKITAIEGIDPETHLWTVPGVPKTKSKCKVKVVLKDASGNPIGSDRSDSYFTIQP